MAENVDDLQLFTVPIAAFVIVLAWLHHTRIPVMPVAQCRDLAFWCMRIKAERVSTKKG